MPVPRSINVTDILLKKSWHNKNCYHRKSCLKAGWTLSRSPSLHENLFAIICLVLFNTINWILIVLSLLLMFEQYSIALILMKMKRNLVWNRFGFIRYSRAFSEITMQLSMEQTIPNFVHDLFEDGSYKT